MWLDRLTESLTRRMAQRTSRRGMLKHIGTLLVGSAALPLLPSAHAVEMPHEDKPEDPGDPIQCDYWRYCSMSGYLCSCCGGTHTSCPPGTEMSPITWVGTCLNPGDGQHYIISYNHCCGKTGCGACKCERNESDTPMYHPETANDINWCLGTRSAVYHCSTAIVLGTASDQM